jgi:ABC-type phosphate transport system substrate-binding protein
MSRTQRLIFLAIAVVIAVVAVVVLAGGGDDSSTSTTPAPTATATPESTPGADGEPTPTPTATPEPTPEAVVLEAGKEQRIEVKQGERVNLVVRSDTADEVHVHGYDILREVKAGGSVRLSFTANITGIFEIELENAHAKLATLVVEPK